MFSNEKWKDGRQQLITKPPPPHRRRRRRCGRWLGLSFPFQNDDDLFS